MGKPAELWHSGIEMAGSPVVLNKFNIMPLSCSFPASTVPIFLDYNQQLIRASSFDVLYIIEFPEQTP